MPENAQNACSPIGRTFDIAVAALEMTLIALAFASYLVPWIIALCSGPIVTYVNAWNEETYLSYQGAMSGRNLPGYYALHLSVLAHRMGMSGLLQNFIADVFVPTAVFWFVMATFARLSRPRSLSVAYAAIIMFGSVLFNYANPFIARAFGPERKTGHLLPGLESYASILKTPNPEFSYLLIAAAFYFFVRTRRMWILLLPIPLLYWFVAAPYLFCVAAIFVHTTARFRFPFLRYMVSFTAAYLLLVAFYEVAFRLAATGSIETERFMTMERQVYAALATSATAALLLMAEICVALSGRQIQPAWRMSAWTLVASGVAVTNLQFLAGFSLVLHKYVDSGVSFFASAALVTLIDAIVFGVSREWSPLIKRVLRLLTIETTLATIVAFMLLAYGFSLREHRFKVYTGFRLAQPAQLNRIRQDPLHAIILDTEFSSKIAYGNARMLIPPFSYEYKFPNIASDCAVILDIRKDAVSAAAKLWGRNDDRVVTLSRSLTVYNQTFENAPKRPPADYCTQSLRAGHFYVVDVSGPLITDFPR
jgi:hypothetical protein